MCYKSGKEPKDASVFFELRIPFLAPHSQCVGLKDVTLLRERFAWEESSPKKQKSESLASLASAGDLKKALGGNYLLSKILADTNVRSRTSTDNKKLKKQPDPAGHLLL